MLSGMPLTAPVVQAETPLRDNVFQSLETLKARVSRARKEGIDTAREQVTITTAELFLKYAQWDANHALELVQALNGWWRLRDAALNWRRRCLNRC